MKLKVFNILYEKEDQAENQYYSSSIHCQKANQYTISLCFYCIFPFICLFNRSTHTYNGSYSFPVRSTEKCLCSFLNHICLFHIRMINKTKICNRYNKSYLFIIHELLNCILSATWWKRGKDCINFIVEIFEWCCDIVILIFCTCENTHFVCDIHLIGWNSHFL